MNRIPRLFTAVVLPLLCLFWLDESPAVNADDYSEQLPRIPATAPQDTLSNFQVADGYRMELIASEPLVTSPVAIEWNADGALYVCEMRGYSENRADAISRITRLSDDNHDGIYDSRTIFADHLLWPTALFPYDGGLFVADAPHIYYFKDDDGDGVAEKKTIALTGFSTSNVQGLLNSFRWGLDNRIHVACGTVGGKVRRASAPSSTAIEVRGHDLAFDPNTYEFQLTGGGAQHGMCFDDWGRKFVSSNSDHLQQVMYSPQYIDRNQYLIAPPTRLSIAADGPQAEVFRISPVEPWRIVRTRLRVAGVVGGPIEGGGRAAGYFTGATGVTIYRGDAWPAQNRGLAIVGDVGSNLIHRKRLQPNGVAMVGRRIDAKSEFVRSTDNWFRPAQFACGPDGALSVVDVYREVIEHPKSLPPEIKRHLDLTSGRDRGRIYRIVPSRFQHRPTPSLNSFATPDLVAMLEHPNAWHRETAARLLFQRQDQSAVAPLREQIRSSSSALARLHSLYALNGLGALRYSDVKTGLNDSRPEIVRHALILAEQFPKEDSIADDLEPLLNHHNLEVRYQLAMTIGNLPIPQHWTWLKSLAMQSPNDRWMRTAILSSIGDSPDKLFQQLLDSESQEDHEQLLSTLAVQIRGSGNQRAQIQALSSLCESVDHPFTLPMITRLVRSIHSNQIDSSLKRRIAAKKDRLITAALQTVLDSTQADSVRIAATNHLTEIRMEAVTSAFIDLLSPTESADIQLAAIKALSSNTDPTLVNRLIDRWPTWSPRLRASAEPVLFASAANTNSVLRAIQEEQLSAADIPLSRWNALANSQSKWVKQFATAEIKRRQEVSRSSVVERYQDTLNKSGNPESGFEVFKQHCAGCHRTSGNRQGAVGHEIGPNLAAAATRGAESILINVLDPNREVNPQYMNYVILTQDGKTVTGMIDSESSNHLTLRRAESVTESVLRSDIDVIRNTNQSIMPEGLEKSITVDAMSDLIAYLIQCSQSPAE